MCIFHKQGFIYSQILIAWVAAVPLYMLSGPSPLLEVLFNVTGTLNGAIALGALIGPVFGGAITQVSDFTWTLTSLAGLSLLVVVVMSVYLLSMKLLKLPLKPTDSVEVNVENGEKEKLLAESSNEE
ncbi:hypothetical protein EB796_021356 [Bugula neritina]|uniref:SLC18B1 n=1 Tax=Bugula neritina TaxID=10212 RepID=A0A7J7J3V3_BUGNE|nr:hypothetical protein EB796_021356 [Bugula neritina]